MSSRSPFGCSGPFLFTAFATVPVVYNKQRQFFLAATSYNVLALLVLTLMFGPAILWRRSGSWV